jgi:hypothetical protein
MAAALLLLPCYLELLFPHTFNIFPPSPYLPLPPFLLLIIASLLLISCPSSYFSFFLFFPPFLGSPNASKFTTPLPDAQAAPVVRFH